ncbi:hypothetical protein YC2023_084820 [Brassica napus]
MIRVTCNYSNNNTTMLFSSRLGSTKTIAYTHLKESKRRYLSIPFRNNRRFREPPGERDSHRLRVHRLLSSTRATARERNHRFVEESTEREQSPFPSSRRATRERNRLCPSSTRETPVDVDDLHREGETIAIFVTFTEQTRRERKERKKRERLHRSSTQYRLTRRTKERVFKHLIKERPFVLLRSKQFETICTGLNDYFELLSTATNRKSCVCGWRYDGGVAVCGEQNMPIVLQKFQVSFHLSISQS